MDDGCAALIFLLLLAVIGYYLVVYIIVPIVLFVILYVVVPIFGFGVAAVLVAVATGSAWGGVHGCLNYYRSFTKNVRFE